ncbi:signal peptidase I [Thermoguttaceae bacterium LCP21S3_D4]|jgi:signal peptidase I|nr:signal peptidase I [Lachnospiraceae bacterium]HCJ75493.1 signal peptidase I [Roseburia sp.]
MQKKERNEELEYIDDLEDVEEAEESEDYREELEEPEGGNAETGSGRKRKKNSDGKNAASAAGEFLSWVLTIVAAVLIAMFLNRFVLINAEIPSGSMENTIMTGDKLIGFRWAYLFSEPERGDIIIFKFPDDESQNYVKRVIGCPGDTVKIENGKVYVNGELLEEDYLKETWTIATGPYTFEVPEDSYFVMGDNRNNSYDGRYWTNTYVKKDKILGKAIFRYWPLKDFKVLN